MHDSRRPKTETWEGEAYEINLLSEKRNFHPRDKLPLGGVVIDDGKHWRYQITALSFEFGNLLVLRVPTSREQLPIGALGHQESMVVLANADQELTSTRLNAGLRVS